MKPDTYIYFDDDYTDFYDSACENGNLKMVDQC